MGSIREDLIEAADSVEDEEKEEKVAAAPEVEAEVTEPEAEPEVVAEPEETPEKVEEPEAEPETVVAKGKDYNVEKPPSGWTPDNREMWADVPAQLKQQIMKRDHEVEDVLRNTAEARKSFKQFNEAIEPYRAMIASQGTDPMQAVSGLLQTAAALQMGSPQQKAERISQLINHYGVDINTLDTILSGQQPDDKPDNAVQAAIDARMQPMENFFNEMKNRQYQNQQSSNQQIQDDIGAFEQKAEFFEDVREDMADLMDFATKRGQELTLKGAYDKACSLHPEISKIMTQRKTQTDLGIKKQVSNGTLNNNLGGVPVAAEMSMRDQLESLWDGEEA